MILDSLISHKLCTVILLFTTFAQLMYILNNAVYYNYSYNYTSDLKTRACNISIIDSVEFLQRQLSILESNHWLYIKSELGHMKKDCETQRYIHLIKRIQSLYHNILDHHNISLRYLQALENVNKEWRETEVEALSDLVQRWISRLQNPANCSSARKMVCKINKPCGFGCQVHTMLYCFMRAIGTNRTFVLESHNWHYAKKGWEKNFLPLSNTCQDREGTSSGIWNGKTVQEDVQVLELYEVYYYGMHPPIPQLPLTVPADIAPRLRVLHERPGLWFLAQLLHYLLRPLPHIQRMLDDMEAKLNFTRPIVGVHVRRTDKVGTEAAFHPIEEYMVQVDEWWDNFELLNGKGSRKIYLATDEAELLGAVHEQYPHYHIISNSTFSHAAQLDSRYSETSLLGIITDVYFLSRSNHIVCTLSSQVCRLAYELKQTRHPDATQHVTSLDKEYIFLGSVKQLWRCVHHHVPQQENEIGADIGDLFEVQKNMLNGYIMVQNKETLKIGIIPNYKLRKVINEVMFPM